MNQLKTFFRFENRYMINGSLKMKTALSIGSQTSVLPTGSDLPVIKTADGKPFIPGSSLKGVARSFLERMLRTMEQMNYTINNDKLWACDPLDNKQRCVNSQKKDEFVEKSKRDTVIDDQELTKLIYKESCTVCRFFGSPWLASRVYFMDCFLSNQGQLHRYVEIRDGVGIDRDLGSAKKGIKFDFETVPAGATFEVRIVVENADEWEVGMLLLALRAIRDGTLPIGGKTSRGLGWATFEINIINRVNASGLLDYLRNKSMETLKEDDLVNIFISTLNQGG